MEPYLLGAGRVSLQLGHLLLQLPLAGLGLGHLLARCGCGRLLLGHGMHMRLVFCQQLLTQVGGLRQMVGFGPAMLLGIVRSLLRQALHSALESLHCLQLWSYEARVI